MKTVRVPQLLVEVFTERRTPFNAFLMDVSTVLLDVSNRRL